MKKFIISFTSLLAVPAVALAQQFNPDYPTDVLTFGQVWLGRAITILMVLMTLFFLWTVFKLISEKDPGKLKDRRKMVTNGIIGLFVAVAVWGIIRILSGVFGFNSLNTAAPNITCPPGFTNINGVCQPR